MKKKCGIVETAERLTRDFLIRRGVASVLAGVSGGADSTALLLMLRASGVRTEAIHCNFHLRGSESMRDERRVGKLCGDLGVTLHTVDFDVDAYRRLHPGSSLEMACRDLRYEVFENLRRELRLDRIAVAHNADDNAETLLLNLFRGSGITGLRGMLPDTGSVIRPLLGMSRSDIEQYLELKGEKFVTDSSNLQSDFRRNFIRNELMPMIRQRWAGVDKAFSKTLENLRSEENVISEAEQRWIPTDNFLSLELISQAPDKFWIIYRFASRYGATRDVALEILDVYNKKAGSQLIVGKSWKAGNGKLLFRMKGLEYIGLKEGDNAENAKKE